MENKLVKDLTVNEFTEIIKKLILELKKTNKNYSESEKSDLIDFIKRNFEPCDNGVLAEIFYNCIKFYFPNKYTNALIGRYVKNTGFKSGVCRDENKTKIFYYLKPKVFNGKSIWPIPNQ